MVDQVVPMTAEGVRYVVDHFERQGSDPSQMLAVARTDTGEIFYVTSAWVEMVRGESVLRVGVTPPWRVQGKAYSNACEQAAGTDDDEWCKGCPGYGPKADTCQHGCHKGE